MPKQCKDCRWYDAHGFIDNRDTYVCRRYPPAYYNGQEERGSHSGFPFVRSFDWCGEWAPTEEATKAKLAQFKEDLETLGL